MKITERLYLTNRDDWRDWLRENHDEENEVWLVYYKKHTGKPRIPYDDAVEEALCFGWVDTTVKRVDDERFVQRFAPRRKNSTWSEANKKRAQKMIAEGRMTSVGLAKFEDAPEVEEPEPKEGTAGQLDLPDDLKEALRAKKEAWENFTGLAAGYQRTYIDWLNSAKRIETRQRRLAEILKRAERNEKPGMT